LEGTQSFTFADGLLKALQGEADVIPAGKKWSTPQAMEFTGVTELYLYLRDQVEIGSKERVKHRDLRFYLGTIEANISLVPGAGTAPKPAPPV
jgi:hypothetical protein